MILLLFIVLFLLLIIHLLIYKIDWLSPTILSLLSYIISVGVLLINSSNWNIFINFKTVTIIFSGFILMSLGELLSRSMHSKTTNTFKPENNIVTIIPKDRFTNLVILFMIMIAILFFYHINFIASSVTVESTTLLGAYNSVDDVNMNFLLKVSMTLCLPISYYYSLAFIENLVFLDNIRIKLLVPIFIFGIIEAMSGARMDILYLVLAIIAISFITHQTKRGWELKINFKVLSRTIGVIVITLILFYLLGNLTGKSNQNDFFYIVSLYIGSPIAALDYFLENFTYSIENFGHETLIGINNLFGNFGIQLDLGNAPRHHEFVLLGNMESTTNIYTSYRSIINDYGIIGVIIYQFLNGFIISFFYEKIKRKTYKNNKLLILIYVYVIRYLFFNFANERLIINMFTSTTIIQIVCFYVLLKYCSTYKDVVISKKKEISKKLEALR